MAIGRARAPSLAPRVRCLAEEIRHVPRGARQPHTIESACAEAHGVNDRAASLAGTAVERARHRHRPRLRHECRLVATYPRVKLTVDQHLRRVHVERGERHLMRASLDGRRLLGELVVCTST